MSSAASGRVHVAPPSRLVRWCTAALLSCAGTTAADPPKPAPTIPVSIARICDLAGLHARRERLPEAFFARLLWKESRFDAAAVSPAGAEGIAQFMPGTAKLRGLDDSFDIEQAIPASARYLGVLRDKFGNLGLAAAAYNAGEERVRRWLASGGFLPLETENYVLDILGEPADAFVARTAAVVVRPLDGKKPFTAACRALPFEGAETVAMASVHRQPWGIQVAGDFRRAVAVRQYQRLRSRFAGQIGEAEPVVSRIRTPRGRRGLYAVRIGAATRQAADAICHSLRRAGGSCIVLRNR